ncbi:MAG: phosphohydrolase [Thermoprotei archaeon]|nr:MAG: phosphohydrolase [Thermoprotei archaeon]
MTTKRIATGSGFELEVPTSYSDLQRKAEREIEISLKKYPKAYKLWCLLKEDAEVNACWDMADYIAVAKLGYNDHGEVHAKIVAANALKMLDLLLSAGILPDIMKEKAGDEDDAHLVVMAGGLLHDIGNQVHRKDHPLHSVYLAISILNRLLPLIYNDHEVMYEVRGHILHTIYAHGAEIPDLTIEAALVGIADGTDMTKGRGRLAFDTGNINIHTVSALSIENVEIVEGENKAIEVRIEMNNSAGVFQVQETLVPKISRGPLEKHVDIVAVTIPEGDKDTRIVKRLSIREGKLTPT